MSIDFTDRQCEREYAETAVLPDQEAGAGTDGGQDDGAGDSDRDPRHLSERDADILGSLGLRADARRREDDEEEAEEDDEFGDDDEAELDDEDEEFDEEFDDEAEEGLDDDDDEVEVDDEE
jgi:hypothetical protein